MSDKQLHPKHVEWIEARGLDPELAAKMGLSTKRDEQGFWLAVPYLEQGRPINHKYRQTSAKRHMMDGGAPLLWWNVDCLNDPAVSSPSHPVVITEGEWDALAAMQAGRPHVLSVPNGAPSEATDATLDPEQDAARFGFFWRSRELTDRVARFIIATDADRPGRILAHELVRRLGAERCLFVTYPDGCKDLNDVLLQHGAAAVAGVLSSAKAYPVRGLYGIDDFPEPPEVQKLSHGIPALCDMLPVVPGTFTVGTGYAGQGKTSLIVKMLANLMRQRVTVALGSFETAVKPILVRKLRAAICETGEYNCPDDLAADADELIRQHLRIIAQQASDDDADMTLDDMLELARIAVLRDGAKLVLIDPWNELDHKRQSDESETDYTSRAIRTMKRFARTYDVALWVIAHPAKPQMVGAKLPVPGLYSISGSAHWANKPDFGFVVHRPKRDTDLVDVHVTKVRMGLPGKMGKVTLEYDWRASRYLEVRDDPAFALSADA